MANAGKQPSVPSWSGGEGEEPGLQPELASAVLLGPSLGLLPQPLPQDAHCVMEGVWEAFLD